MPLSENGGKRNKTAMPTSTTSNRIPTFKATTMYYRFGDGPERWASAMGLSDGLQRWALAMD